jgi:hypothetical protein
MVAALVVVSEMSETHRQRSRKVWHPVHYVLKRRLAGGVVSQLDVGTDSHRC